jgi:predicted RNA binding protein YcfA (HicA-like mRNA interferase family)
VTRRERDLRRLARQHGWKLTRTNSSHWRLRHPRTGAIVIAAFSPGDSGHLRVIEGALRRAERDRPPLDPTSQRDVAGEEFHDG